MCEHCRNIQTWRKFDAPKDYLGIIVGILRWSMEKGRSNLLAANENMAHMIRCKHCGQIFTCVVNTWRGSEHFRKGKG